jgi:hypothetical protein
VLLELAIAQTSMPQLETLLVCANELTKEQFRDIAKGKEDVLALLRGIAPRLRFKPFV